MERNEIRGAVACLAYAAEVNEDNELATILNVVHAAILHNDTHRLVQHLNTYNVMLYHTNDDVAARNVRAQTELLEHIVG